MPLHNARRNPVRLRCLSRHAAAAGAATALASTACAGIVTTWIGPDGGHFDVPRNWSEGVPTVEDTALFDGVGGMSVIVDPPGEANRLIFRNGSFTLSIAESLIGASTTAVAPSIVVSDESTSVASLIVDSGTFVGHHATVASAMGAAGSIEVGADAALLLEGILGVGTSGDAIVTIDGNFSALGVQIGNSSLAVGAFELVGGAGTVTDLVLVGSFGDGELVVSEGATLLAGEIVAGLNPLSLGTVVVSGADTLVQTVEKLRIAHAGTGVLVIDDGATVEVGSQLIMAVTPAWFFFPFYPGSEGRVEVIGAGTHLSVANGFDLNVSGFGALAVGDGARVTVGEHLLWKNPLRATLEFTIGQASANGGPMVDVVGDVRSFYGPSTFPYTVSVAPNPDAPPVAGDAFVLIEATEIEPVYTLELTPVDGLVAITAIVVDNGREQLVVKFLSSPDLNGDGMVDGADLGLLLGQWGRCAGCTADLNGDGVVDGADLGLLLFSWGVQP